MEGSLLGALAAAVIFMAFQLCGMIGAFGLLAQTSFGLRLLAGSVLGLVLFQWLPALFAFFFGFSLLAHLLALALVVVSAGLVWVRCGLKLQAFLPGRHRPNGMLVCVCGVVYLIFAALMLHGFRQADGAVYSSQCTFGDMSMHLGFITSIAKQGVFPPNYSILSGTALAYPFLSDSVSSSLYLFGAPLSFAYFLPMLFAGAQVMGGFILFMRMWLKSSGKALAAFLLFFLNGGLGFAYFLSGVQENPANFTRIFTAFYETPTNLIGENIRFVNVIVDMLIPQRATLFGWAVLFAALCLLFKGIEARCRRCFVLTAVFAGALPMIHTHSFLVLALISGTWLIISIVRCHCPGFRWGIIRGLLLGLPFGMALLQLLLGKDRGAAWLVIPPALLLLGMLATAVIFFIAKKETRALLPNWALYLGLVLLLALPQLLFWTFRQAQGEQFTRGHFNWGNLDDNYLWFYIKNVGVPALLYVPAVLWAKKETLRVIAPVFVILFVSELVVFQPNTYDNNKLIYIAYFFLCGLTADYCAALYRRLQGVRGRGLLAAAGAMLCTCSAVLTIGREAAAEYELFGTDHMRAAEFIETVSAPEDVVLTNGRHNNAIAAITGRNIVCGSPSYVYYHGLDYAGRQEEVAAMYESPASSLALYEKYSVDYVMISSYEQNDYAVDEEKLRALFPLIYETGRIRIYKTTQKELELE